MHRQEGRNGGREGREGDNRVRAEAASEERERGSDQARCREEDPSRRGL